MDKRAKPRFGPLVLKTRVEADGSSREGYLTNISAGGAFLAMDSPPAIGTEVSIRATLPWRLGELRVAARVVWRHQPGTEDAANAPIAGAGLAFQGLDEGAQSTLDAYLERFAELAAQLEEPAPSHDGH